MGGGCTRGQKTHDPGAGKQLDPSSSSQNAFSQYPSVLFLNLFRAEGLYEPSLIFQDSLPMPSLQEKKAKRKEIKESQNSALALTCHQVNNGVLPETPELKLNLEKKEGKERLTSPKSTLTYRIVPISQKHPAARGLKGQALALLSKCQGT